MHKLCPFCGGEPEYFEELEDITPFEQCIVGYIRCTKCFCRTHGLFTFGLDKKHTANEEDVWNLWDRRSD